MRLDLVGKEIGKELRRKLFCNFPGAYYENHK